MRDDEMTAPNGVRYADANAYEVVGGRVHWLTDGTHWALCGHDSAKSPSSELGPASDWHSDLWCRKCFPAEAGA